MRAITASLAVAALLAPESALADFRRFGFVDEPDVLEAGHAQLELVDTVGIGAHVDDPDGVTYRSFAHDVRLQLGFSDSVQLTLDTSIRTLLAVRGGGYSSFDLGGIAFIDQYGAGLKVRLGDPRAEHGVALLFG